ncbi:MAG: PIN domain-containing protein [Anaerolineae bacterium]
MAAILIDTNLLVYLYDHSDSARQQQAQLVLEQLQVTRTGCLSVQTLAKFFSVATRKLKPPLTPAQAYDQVSLFSRLWPVFDLTPFIVLEAARGVRDHQMSYYDAQMWATARLNQTPVIFSEDTPGVSILEGVRFVNPFAPTFHLDEWL